MNVIPDKRDLISLVRDANDGRLCLPNFQRDFVWPRDQVADLIRSVLRGYFIGSLLLLRCDPDRPPFAPLFVRGSNPNSKLPRPELLILDGQQRLTSLLYALTAPDLPLKDSPKRRYFFVDLDLLMTEPDNDGIVFDRTEKELDGLDQPEVQYERHVIPCQRLLSEEGFFTWRDGLDDWLRANRPEDHERYRTEWREPWARAMRELLNFQVPLVELPMIDESNPDSIGRVCAIFEKLNSTGMELTVYDLLTARLYPAGIKLHDLWDEACRDHKLLNEWSEGRADKDKFGVLVLRTLALLRDLDPKPKMLINLKPDSFEKDWRRAAAAMEQALRLLTRVGHDGFGVFDRKWLPGLAMLPVLAALRAQIEDRKLGDEPRRQVRQWYWSNVFLERYSSGVESKSRKDYTEFMNHWVHGASRPAVFGEAQARIGAPGFTVADSMSNASAVYSGIFCMLALRGARDWRRGEAIDLQNLEDHHIYPRAYLKRHGITDRSLVNTIVNRTLISDETNRLIRDKAPADYLADANVFPDGLTEGPLQPHYVDSDARAAMERSGELDSHSVSRTYEQFRAAREAIILDEVRRVTGVKLETSAATTDVA